MTKQFIHFDMIYYSHINEDSCIERNLLQSAGFENCVAIAGSGERVLALMDITPCSKLTVVDLNKDAIFLLQLKIAALTKLSIDAYLRFTGHYAATKEFRWQCFKSLELELTPDCLHFWKTNRSVVGNGILYAGHFERFLARVRPIINFCLGKEFHHAFEHTYLPASFPLQRWKMICWLFSQKWIYRLWGNKDIAFVGTGVSIERIPAALDEVLRKGKASSCFMAHLIFKGHLQNMAETDLPPSLQKQVLKSIQKRLRAGEINIEYHHGDILQLISANHLSTGPTFYSLSDILSFSDDRYLDQLLELLTKEPGNIIVVRSFLRNRLSNRQLITLSIKYGKLSVYDEKESTGMYQVFAINGTKQIVNNNSSIHEYKAGTI